MITQSRADEIRYSLISVIRDINYCADVKVYLSVLFPIFLPSTVWVSGPILASRNLSVSSIGESFKTIFKTEPQAFRGYE